MPRKAASTSGAQAQEEAGLNMPWSAEWDDILTRECLQYWYDHRGDIKNRPALLEFYEANKDSANFFYASKINSRVITRVRNWAKQNGVQISEDKTRAATRAKSSEVKGKVEGEGGVGSSASTSAGKREAEGCAADGAGEGGAKKKRVGKKKRESSPRDDADYVCLYD